MDSLAKVEQAIDDSLEVAKKEREIEEKKQGAGISLSEAAKEPRIIESIDVLKQRFNDYATTNDLDFRIGDVKIKPGKKRNTFQYLFSNNIVWVGYINKTDNSINGLLMLAKSERTFSSRVDVAVMLMSLMAVTDPSIKEDDRPKLLKRLGVVKGADFAHMNSNVVQDGIKYYLVVNPGKGLLFGAGPVND